MIQTFINENFERDVESFISHKEIHRKYILFAKENGLEEISQSTLTKRLNSMMIGRSDRKFVNRKVTSVRYGLRWKS
ncbi:primase-like DNA-binding domain-containing protein [Lysinibacillus irui]|uniref:primase-like DNA-binding domain-containing protein n=1 Tax=Lysinibacillus irui TaxID=2998077 RepID=UPI004045051D